MHDHIAPQLLGVCLAKCTQQITRSTDRCWQRVLIFLLVLLQRETICYGRFTRANKAHDDYFAICLVVKDQNDDIREFLDYHRYIGTSKVYVFDNGSERPLAGAFLDYLETGFAKYHYGVKYQGRQGWWPSPQRWGYLECLRLYSRFHQWIAFIDADEFIVLRDRSSWIGNRPSINNFLRKYEHYGGLAINWEILGSSGHKKRPKGGVVKSYSSCLPMGNDISRHIKTIANMAFIKTIESAHHVSYWTPDKYSINEVYDRVDGPTATYVSSQSIVLYHYFVQSAEDYKRKVKRGNAAGGNKSASDFAEYDRNATGKCRDLINLSRDIWPETEKPSFNW